MNTEIEKATINFKGLLNDDINIRLKAAKYFSWFVHCPIPCPNRRKQPERYAPLRLDNIKSIL